MGNKELKLTKQVVLDVLGEFPEDLNLASEKARNDLAEALAERSEQIDYATRRKQHMMECTHPKTARNADIEDALWNCTNCGYTKEYETA